MTGADKTGSSHLISPPKNEPSSSGGFPPAEGFGVVRKN